jgi:dTDP-4-dehydrorhamnose reductase
LEREQTAMIDPKHHAIPQERLVITGVDGVVGANLAATLADRFAVLGICQEQAVALDRCEVVRLKPADSSGLAALLEGANPQWIIHCGAMAASSWEIPEEVARAEDEIHLCRSLEETAGRLGSQLTVISSDAVFAGPRMFHSENAPAANSHPFARMVRRVEQSLEGTAALIVRTHAYGWSPRDMDFGFAEQAWQALAEGASRQFLVDCHATPILATDLAELLCRAYLRRLQGVCHLAGAERTSQYRFAAELAGGFGFKTPIESNDADSEKRPATRRNETSLGTQRARRDLETPMPLLRDGLGRFVEQANNGYRARLQSRRRPLAA